MLSFLKRRRPGSDANSQNPLPEEQSQPVSVVDADTMMDDQATLPEYLQFNSLAAFKAHIAANPNVLERGIVDLSNEGPNTKGFFAVYFRDPEGSAYKANTNGSKSCPVFVILNESHNVKDVLAQVKRADLSYSQNPHSFRASAAGARAFSLGDLMQKFESAMSEVFASVAAAPEQQPSSGVSLTSQ